VETARFARTFGTMLRSGVPVLGALAVVGDIMTNQIVGRAVHRLSDTVKRGGTVAAAMQEHTPFPPLAVHMVRVGEETGRLEDMLLKTADTVEAEVRSELRRLIGSWSRHHPGHGRGGGFIVVAMLLAIFSINEIPP
jgi:general secretion pathway protein F